MKTTIFGLIVSILLISLVPHVSTAAQGISSDGRIESGAVVCAADVCLAPPGDCLPAGPSAHVTEMTKLGLTFP
jgi:hypothetical protein